MIPSPPYPKPTNLLAGRTALITAAAGTGIGFATALRFAEEGAALLISDIHPRRLAEAADKIKDKTINAPPPSNSATSPTKTRSRRSTQLRKTPSVPPISSSTTPA